MKNTGLADSPLFENSFNINNKLSRNHDKIKSRNHEIVKPINQEINISEILNAIQDVGKYASTCRFTIKEKRFLTEIVYLHSLNNFHITVNDLIRIGLNILLINYQKNKRDSLIFKITGL